MRNDHDQSTGSAVGCEHTSSLDPEIKDHSMHKFTINSVHSETCNSSGSTDSFFLWPDSCYSINSLPSSANSNIAKNNLSPLFNSSDKVEEITDNKTCLMLQNGREYSVAPTAATFSLTSSLMPGQIMYLSPNSIIICVKQEQLYQVFSQEEANKSFIQSFNIDYVILVNFI